MELNLSIKDKFYDEKGSTFSVSKPDIYDDYRRTMDAEMFEKLVHDIILTKYSDCSETNEFILSLPKREQRLAIMSLIDGETKGDNNLLWSEMKAYVDSRPDKMEHLKDVIRIINKFVKDGSVEKKTYGEVLTPISLVNEMLETLPKEVWSNPDLKWLDPANGSGNFPFVVMYKLMKGLSEWEPDPEKRYKHIVENMIYVCELQSRNVFLWLCGIDPFDEYTTNTYWGSFLDEGFDKHMKEVWGLDKFDIVVGNPPYQDSSKNGGFQPKNHNLWSKFIIKSEYKLNDSGFLVFVTPDSWRSPSSKILNLFKKNTLLKVEFDVAKHFPGVGSTFSYYTLKIGKFDDRCEIYDIYLDVNKLKFIPNGGKIGLSIHLKTTMCDNEKIELHCDTTSNHSSSKRHQLSKSISNENRYKLYHTNAQTFYSTNKSKNHNDKKVYFTISGYFNPRYDDGDISTSEICPYVIVNDDTSGENLLSFLNSKLYRFLINSAKWSGFLNKDVLRLLPNMKTNKKYTDDDIYDFFKITKEEIEFIEKMNL